MEKHFLAVMDRFFIFLLLVSGEEKQKLTIEDLLTEFQRIRGQKFESDRAVRG